MFFFVIYFKSSNSQMGLQYAMRQCQFYLMAFLFRFLDGFFSFVISTKCSLLSQRDLCETIQVEINEKTYPEHNDYIDLLVDLVEQLGPFKMVEKWFLFLSLSCYHFVFIETALISIVIVHCRINFIPFYVKSNQNVSSN